MWAIPSTIFKNDFTSNIYKPEDLVILEQDDDHFSEGMSLIPGVIYVFPCAQIAVYI
jgi:hypothetical protein